MSEQRASRIFSLELYPTNSEYSAVKETDLQKGDWDFGYTCMNTGILGVVNDQGGVPCWNIGLRYLLMHGGKKKHSCNWLMAWPIY